MNSSLLVGEVGHARPRGPHNVFRYGSLLIRFRLSARASLRSPLFSLERWNLFGHHWRDHGNGADGEAWARDILARHGITAADGDIELICQPRVLGFVFNPVSFWFCLDRDGQRRAVLAEVNNTFGERHVYLLTAPGQGVIGNDCELNCRKVFHVSPFMPVAGEYRFRFSRVDGAAETREQLHIDYWRDGELQLATWVHAVHQPADTRHLLGALFRFGWSTVLVVWRIHWQALKLWLRGATFHRKPAPPVEEITQ
ncbi:DUF1365 domain-containing protein [Perlucidibaca piscinae]|uniref:DUF1365 domain-containing protein n=1 Tax=Perlucidibaca piscinae TaxID=392589 RepID=UPI0003B4A508|nr:DUF1365 domain-containing protein [Perlucidibaca piscinae]